MEYVRCLVCNGVISSMPKDKEIYMAEYNIIYVPLVTGYDGYINLKYKY